MLRDFLAFRTMISPSLIKSLYFIGAILSIGGVAYTIRQIESDNLRILYGFGGLIVANLAWRVLCESLILFFSMHDLLHSINQQNNKK